VRLLSSLEITMKSFSLSSQATACYVLSRRISRAALSFPIKFDVVNAPLALRHESHSSAQILHRLIK
jgi:hypothetical protein